MEVFLERLKNSATIRSDTDRRTELSALKTELRTRPPEERLSELLRIFPYALRGYISVTAGAEAMEVAAFAAGRKSERTAESRKRLMKAVDESWNANGVTVDVHLLATNLAVSGFTADDFDYRWVRHFYELLVLIEKHELQAGIAKSAVIELFGNIAFAMAASPNEDWRQVEAMLNRFSKRSDIIGGAAILARGVRDVELVV